jgi:hypothetical protein
VNGPPRRLRVAGRVGETASLLVTVRRRRRVPALGRSALTELRAAATVESEDVEPLPPLTPTLKSAV